MVNLAQGLHVLKALLYSSIFSSSQVIFILLIWILNPYILLFKQLEIPFIQSRPSFSFQFLTSIFFNKEGFLLIFFTNSKVESHFYFLLSWFYFLFTFHTLIEDFGLSWLFKQTNAQKRIYKLAFRDTFSSVGSNEDHNQHRLIWCKEDSTPS